jgi:hypothetical protein
MFGFHVLLAYEGKAGPASTLSQSWPLASSLRPSSATPYTLVMFVHPQCPCTNASISELALLMTHCSTLSTYVLFLRPKGFEVGWEKTALWKRVAAIPGVKPISDIDGQESANFIAATSGQSGLYNRRGKLLFEGGVTGSRGHEGENQSLSTIEAIVCGKSAQIVKTAVFGCSLKDDPSDSREANHSCLR